MGAPSEIIRGPHFVSLSMVFLLCDSNCPPPVLPLSCPAYPLPLSFSYLQPYQFLFLLSKLIAHFPNPSACGYILAYLNLQKKKKREKKEKSFKIVLKNSATLSID